jgi:hypothetical protein
LTVKVREDGRVVNVQALIAAAVNADGYPGTNRLHTAAGPCREHSGSHPFAATDWARRR